MNNSWLTADTSVNNINSVERVLIGNNQLLRLQNSDGVNV